MKKHSINLIVLFAIIILVSAFAFAKDIRQQQGTIKLPQVFLSKEIPMLPVIEGKLLKRVKAKHAGMQSFKDNAVPDNKLDFSVRVSPDLPAVFKIDSMVGTLSLDQSSPIDFESKRDLSIIDASKKVGEIDSAWQGGFDARMARLDEDRAIALSRLLLENTQDNCNDELAYVLSSMSAEDLSGSYDPDMLLENAKLIYQQAENLDYVAIVELDDGHTTLEYQLDSDDGVYTWQLPYDIYYRAVVNMKLDWERPLPIDPETGNQGENSSDSLFWRQYFLDPQEPPQSYANHPVFIKPNNLHADNFPKFATLRNVVFSDFAIGPLNLVYRDSDKKPVMIEFNPANYAYSVLATLIPVEQMAIDDDMQLLYNMLYYVNDDRQLVGIQEVAILKERDPFGEPVIENALTHLDVPYTVIGLDDLADFSENANLRLLKKIIVPSDQPLSFYQALAETGDGTPKAIIEDLIKKGVCFEFHGAVKNEVDIWDGLQMPGGFSRSTTATTKEAYQLLEGGYSKITNLMQNTHLAWDGQTYDGIAGTRLFDPGTFALDKIGFFVGEILMYNVSERRTHWGGSIERAVQPVRISNNHFGNCGEIQDMLGAISRTMLIPTLSVHNSTEDHVWNMVYLADTWIPFQVDWSDEATRIRNHGISYDKQQSGSKDCSCIVVSEGDGSVRSTIDDYSDFVTLNIRVSDSAGRVIDGAKIMVATEAWQSSDLTIGYWGVTNEAGELSVKLGENANYYLRVETPLGSIPSTSNQVSLAIKEADAIAGKEFSLDLEIEASLADLRKTETGAEVTAMEKSYSLELLSNEEYSVALGKNLYTGDIVLHTSSDIKPLWALMNADQLENYLDKNEMIAEKYLTDGENSLTISAKKSMYLVLLPDAFNKETVFSGSIKNFVQYPDIADGDLEADIDGDIEGLETDAEDEASTDGSGGSGCSHSEQSPVGMLFLVMVVIYLRRKPASLHNS